MTTDPTIAAAREAARAKLADLIPGTALADEVADAVLAAIEMPRRRQLADWLERYNPKRDASYADGVEWAVEALRRPV
jgi:hypothetical protein